MEIVANEIMKETIERIISRLELKPHPEGGYFRETYRSTEEIDTKNLGADYSGKRNYSTCIYFLLTSDAFSAFHRIKQDEIWHFYDGSPIHLHVITQDGDHTEYTIGRDFDKGETPQLVVPGGCWFASEVIDPSSYSLVGCTVSPGFDFRDFELESREELTARYPHKAELISRLTHS